MSKLGKGISALIPNKPIFEQETQATGVLLVNIEAIVPNKLQPRTSFDQGKLEELKESIKAKGVIQPVLVRKQGEGYELIAGERRFRAVKELGLEKIPVIVKEIGDEESLEFAIIENIQRDDLNALDEAKGYRQLMEKFSFSQDKIAQAVGKDKSTVSNVLRLLSLPIVVQKYIEENAISMGHAKTLLSLTTEREKIRFAKNFIRKNLSVRQAEEIIKKKNSKNVVISKKKDHNVTEVEDILQHCLGTRVNIQHGTKRGKIEIHYYSNEDLDRIIKIIAKK
ncbi:MAG: ParB/RepB/Spo0J family partition protein [Candidatus Omnitrophica bacterium]|jgi:ParB family chromosome partitioning protein|nr:ParB/RepB/Spo0J family partition protein [Candidatus Omnitrophota bacterium]